MKNKHLLAICVALVLCISATNHVSAQGVAFNTSGAAADASAMVDIASTSKGMLVPRMTTAQLISIPAPATGLLVYQTDGTSGYYFFNGVSWVPLLRGSSGTANYLPMFTSAGALGNSIIYQNPAAGNRIGINYGTTNHGLLALKATSDTEALYINMNGTPGTGGYGIERIEYSNVSDPTRTGILSTMIRSISDVNGIGVEGAGNSQGVYGIAEASSTSGISAYGVEGDSYYDGSYSVGVAGFGHPYVGTPTHCYGIYGYQSGGAPATSYAVYSDGAMHVNGAISKLSGTFKIDHPLDPENKYLSHSFVESPDMMNIYNGNVTTDAGGVAVVTLPDYFEALNKDFRYQLTVIGSFAQAMVSREVNSNSFEIKTNQPNVKVSWQVTGVRHDVWANAHRVVPEQEKESINKGMYMTPKEYGKSDDLKIGTVKHVSKKNDPAIMSKGTSGQK